MSATSYAGKHRRESKRTYWECPEGDGFAVRIDLNKLDNLGGVFSWIGQVDVLETWDQLGGWNALDRASLDYAESLVEQHETEHRDSARQAVRYSWAFCASCGGAGWIGSRTDHKHPGCGHRCILCDPPRGYDRTHAIKEKP